MKHLILLVPFVLALLPGVVGATGPAITLDPTSGLPGSTVVVSGSGFLAGDTVRIAFAGTPERTIYTPGGAFITGITVPSVTPGAYTISATDPSAQSASASFTVTAASSSGGTGTLHLDQAVTVNGLGYETSGTANPGDTLTYRIRYTNTSGVDLQNVTVQDVLAAGQTPLTAIQAGCTYADSTRTVSCTFPVIHAGASGTFYIAVEVDANVAGAIVNVVTASGPNLPATASNPVELLVGHPAPLPIAAQLVLCGFAAFNGSTLTVSGISVPVASGVTFAGLPGDVCLTLTENASGQVSAAVTSPDLAGVPLACGLLTGTAPTPAVAPGTPVDVDGLQLVVAAGAAIPDGLTAGQPYCFVLNNGGGVRGVLVLVPTAAFPSGVPAAARPAARPY